MENSEATEKAEQEGVAKKKKKKKRPGEVRVELSGCKYAILRIVTQKLGWEEADNEKQWHLLWTDASIGPERLMTLKRGQRVNHFLGMLQICRKKSLARHLSNMRRMFPAEYKFFPQAFILPNQIHDLTACLNSERLKTYILKPDNGSQGRGVVLVQNADDLKQAVGGLAGANMLAQKYLTNPMLLNGYKFDLRIYILMLSCDPLHLFLYREGIARFCTEKYMKPERGNLKLSCMHLTNYAVNKNNSKFEFNSSATETDRGSKWALSSLFKALATQGFDVGKVKKQIRKMVVMTIIAILPLLVHNYQNCVNEDDNGRSCFELLGMDVLLDDKCRPWLLEVNHSPSFGIDTPLDFKIKESLLSDTLKLVDIDPLGVSKFQLQDKECAKLRLYGSHQCTKDDPETEHPEVDDFHESYASTQNMNKYECENLGNFDRIYPPEDEKLQCLYNMFLAGSEEAFKQSFDMKVKSAILKAQEDRKREEMEKEAAEKRKMRKRAEMRKKAQESARAAALSHQTASLATIGIDSPETVVLNASHEGLYSEMASPLSTMETVMNWESAETPPGKASEISHGQTEKVRGSSSHTDMIPSFLQERAFADPHAHDSLEVISRSKEILNFGSYPRPVLPKAHGILDHVHQPCKAGSGIHGFSSFLSIVPQALGRQQLWKPCLLGTSLKDRTSELDGDSLFIRRHCIRNSPESKHASLLVPKHSAPLLTRQCYGRLPQLKEGFPPRHGTYFEPFLGESKALHSSSKLQEDGLARIPIGAQCQSAEHNMHGIFAKSIRGIQIPSFSGSFIDRRLQK
eukprot:c24316_g1_i2 orf=397-2796(-)